MKRIWMMLALTVGCSSNDETLLDSPEQPPVLERPDLNEILLPPSPASLVAPGEDLAESQARLDEDLRLNPPGPAPERIWTHEDDPYADPPLEEGEVEKANDSFPALAGWALHGELAFQDGINDAPGKPDHCSHFGLDCDDAWHIQALDIQIDSHVDFLDSNSLRTPGARCGSLFQRPDLTTNEWRPCLMPYIHLSTTGRRWRWYYDETACPNNSSQREDFRIAIQAMFTYLENNTLLTFPRTTNVSEAKVIVKCDSTVPASAAARFSAAGPLMLRYATAVQGEIVEWTDECETAGLPGSTFPPVQYTQRPDMMYTYSKVDIGVNWSGLFNFLSCTTQVLPRRSGIFNILLHEMMHGFSFAHDQYADITFGVMRAGLTCAQTVATSMGISQLHRESINDIDMDASGDALDIHDNDLSCFIPTGQ